MSEQQENNFSSQVPIDPPQPVSLPAAQQAALPVDFSAELDNSLRLMTIIEAANSDPDSRDIVQAAEPPPAKDILND